VLDKKKQANHACFYQEAYSHTESGLGFFYLITRDQVAPPILCFIHWLCARYKLFLWLWLWFTLIYCHVLVETL